MGKSQVEYSGLRVFFNCAMSPEAQPTSVQWGARGRLLSSLLPSLLQQRGKCSLNGELNQRSGGGFVGKSAQSANDLQTLTLEHGIFIRFCEEP